MAGILDESEDIIDETTKGTAQRDTGLILAGQKTEHYKIATYNGLANLAETIGYNNAADVLRKTLAEDRAADALLTQIAQHNVNYQLN